jgi:hypothetical protein
LPPKTDLDDLLEPLPFYLRIADLRIEIGGFYADRGAALPFAYRPFLNSGPKDFDLILGAEPRSLRPATRVFDCPPIWSLHRASAASIFSVYENYPELKATLTVPDEGDTARLDLVGINAEPFRGPAMELLMISRLVPRHGVVLHGCGIDAGGRGIVFAGESGAGKSTLSRLWAAQAGIRVLSDDRVIVRRLDGRFRLYGTPWHGEARFGSPGGVPLERVYFIRHETHNATKAIRPAAAVREFLKCSFPPYWSASGMKAALELYVQLATEVPCAELFFVPDESIVEFAGGIG